MSRIHAEAFAKLRAHWRGESNGKGALWSVCPICRVQPATLGVGTVAGLWVRCWNPDCTADEAKVVSALRIRPDPWSREGMLERIERVIAQLEWSLRDLLEPPDIPVPGEGRRR